MTHEAILEAVRGPWQLAVPPGLPPVLQEMMMAALSKEPQNRCASPLSCCAGGACGILVLIKNGCVTATDVGNVAVLYGPVHWLA